MMSEGLGELYQDVILDHGRNPRNHRRPAAANRTAEGENPLCGDRLTVLLTIGDDDTILDAAFQGRGCAISIASCSLMTEIVRGKSRRQALALVEAFHVMAGGGDATLPAGLDNEDIDRLRALAPVRDYPARIKCAALAWRAMAAALAEDKPMVTE